MSDKEETSSAPDKPGVVDLSALQNISFGPNWSTGAKTNTGRGGNRDAEAGSDRRDGSPPRRDRRPPVQRSSGGQGGGGFRRESGGRERRTGDRPERSAQAASREAKPIKPVVDVMFYPEDAAIDALSNAMKKSCRTYELFEIARLILEKPERFVAVIKRLPDDAGSTAKLYCAQPGGMPFLDEDQALGHAVKEQMESLFTTEEVEVDPPKGSFQIITRCGITGELLGPPNYHRYQHLLHEHHSRNLATLSFERFQAKLESVREQEVIDAWLAKMTKATHYRLKAPVEGQTEVFESPEAVRHYLLTHHRDALVKTLDSARVSGRLLETMPKGDLRASIEASREYQSRFPLNTANNLRGRLRRIKFCIYKKGSKGISYVCAVKRKFRAPQTVFAEPIQQVFSFIESNPLINVSELPAKMLGLTEEAVSEHAGVRQALMNLRWLIHEGYVTEYGDGRLFAPAPLPEAKNKTTQGETDGDDDDHDDHDDQEHAVAENKADSGDQPSAPNQPIVPSEESLQVHREPPASPGPLADTLESGDKKAD